jgi:hypothetical protein
MTAAVVLRTRHQRAEQQTDDLTRACPRTETFQNEATRGGCFAVTPLLL